MTYRILFLLVFGTSLFSFAQTTAVTEYGDRVYLYEDGTWKFIEGEQEEVIEIPVNETPFEKSAKSKFLLKSKVFNVGIYIDTKEWRFSKPVNEEDGEYDLSLKKEDLYGTVITEKIAIPLETLKDIALSNARDVAPDTKIDKQEYRTVNGAKVLMLEMSGTMSGIKFAYKGYYYSNENGTIQIILYTSSNLIQGYDDRIEKLLNGFVVIED